MRAIILAAGRGERMRPLTDTCPKPLLTVQGLPLIVHHINKLKAVGINDIVINHAWLGSQIVEFLGDGRRWGVTISYSAEPNGALETAGGIIKALPLLCQKDDSSPFLVVNGDIYTGFTFTGLPELATNKLAHLWLVDNPSHNLGGDFTLSEGILANLSENKKCKSYTYTGIGLYRPAFFSLPDLQQGVIPLGPLLRKYATQGKITASLINEPWTDVGTPERLAMLNKLSETE